MSFGAESDLSGGSSFAEYVMGGKRSHRPIIKPYGVTTTKGKIYVCDTQIGAVETVDLATRKLYYLKPSGDDALGTPIHSAVDTDGTMYVSDTKRQQVVIFNKDGRATGLLHKREVIKPCALAVDNDRLYVSDLKDHNIRVYRKSTRELLFTVPRDPADAKAKLFSPTNLAVDQKGNMYVSDSGGFSVQIYDSEGKHIRTIGEQGLEPGRFALPKGIGVDREGRIYVVDAATAVVQIFDNEGKLLMFFGEPKKSGQGELYLPAGMAIDYENVDFFQQYVAPGYKLDYVIFIINQAGLGKVSAYGFLRKA